MSGFQNDRVFVYQDGRFTDRAEEAGLTGWRDGRGVVEADFDGDGRPDILIVVQGAPFFLAKNRFVPGPDSAAPPNFIGLTLRGDGHQVATNAVGSKVRVSVVDDGAGLLPQYREVSAGNGLSAQSSYRIVIGLASYSGPVEVMVTWTNGRVETYPALASGKYHTLTYAGNVSIADGK